MSKERTVGEVEKRRDNGIENLRRLITQMIESGDSNELARADKLSYWIKDWSRFLGQEKTFDPKRLIKYKRGDVLSVHLGFNLGSEEGGLHYAAVLDVDNAFGSPVITIVPLTSVKDESAPLRKGNVALGNMLYTQLELKIKTTLRRAYSEKNTVVKLLDEFNRSGSEDEAAMSMIHQRIDKIELELKELENMDSAISKLKKGSIALVNQITTISKMRIYDPKTCHDVLSGIRLSNEALDDIDAELIKLYTHHNKK